MKNVIGLISVKNHNYGSILQAYALQQILKNKGIVTEIVDYKKNNGLKQLLRVFNFPLLKSKLKTIWKEIYCKRNPVVGEILGKREESFQKFIKENLIFSRKCSGRRELVCLAQEYPAFILGSDQVWNPMNLGSDYYTLSFVPDEKLKVTYAPSFGVASIPKYQKRRTIKYLKRIDEISVRETSGADIVKKLIGKSVPVVIDPTLLHTAEEWNVYIENERIIDEPYIFAYFVGNTDEHRRDTQRLADKTGYKIIGIPFVDEIVRADFIYAEEANAYVGPSEFVNLIRHADYICTDSFHAVAFSIQYHKKFFVYDRYKAFDKASMNSRLASLLNRLEMEDRMVTKRGSVCEWYLDEINYMNVEKKLKVFREDSERYLNKVIGLLKGCLYSSNIDRE